MEWTLHERPFALNEARDRSSSLGPGWRFRATNKAGDETMIRVMQVRRCPGVMTERAARQAITPYLNHAKPPAMLVRNEEGRFQPLR